MKATEHVFHSEGKAFRLFFSETPEEDPAHKRCDGCAFAKGSGACADSERVASCWGDEGYGVWKEWIDLPMKTDRPCRSPYCECDPGKCTEGREDKRGEPFTPDTKPTNPKDLVGVRKAGLSCVPMNVVAEIGVGMTEGACKYGRDNFRAVGVRSSVYFDAAMRHLISWWEGEDLDPDSDLHHVAKALACLTVLRDAQHQGKCTDDRPPRSKPFYAELNAKAAAILDRHADKSPRHYTIEDSE